jgi:hypothetical protein
MMRVDTVYLNGKVWPGQQRSGDQHVDHLTALAVADGRVVFCGTDDEVRDVVGVDTVTIDLDGRRVVPGLIDGHIHATRAGTTWSRELHWEKIFDVESALATIRDAAGGIPRNSSISAFPRATSSIVRVASTRSTCKPSMKSRSSTVRACARPVWASYLTRDLTS